MTRVLRSLRRGLAHAVVLTLSLSSRPDRQHFQTFIRLLHNSKLELKEGNLPRLMMVLDAHAQTHQLAGDADDGLRLAEAVAALYPMPHLRYCFRRSILRYVILRALERQPSFVIGVRRQSAMLDGHAWIEIDGMAIEEHDDLYQKMVVMYRHPKHE